MYTYNLGQAFHNICRQYGNKTAIIFDGKDQITFQELDILSNKAANFLISMGIKKMDVVAIQNKKSPIGFAMMVACLKLGVIYTNFDYTNPAERIRKIFHTAAPRLVFADEQNTAIENLCKELHIRYFPVNANGVLIDSEEDCLDQQLMNAVSGMNPAYIMFTSGATGIPKGVLISQKSLLNFIQWGAETYQLSTTDIMTNVNPIYFDNSVFDFYCSVFNGITMVALSKAVVEKPAEMLKIIDDIGCTFWFSVPSMLIYLTNLKLLTKETLKNVRAFSFGGEGYPKELLRKLYHVYGETADFYNVYGPTEGTCICSVYKIQKEDIDEAGLAPLGRIAPNFEYVILNEEGECCNCGELCLMGDQLALGYYNDVERTNKSFVRYNGISAYYSRMYRTGDLVEVRNKKLYFIGRADNQVKHMGYRIELEEVENALVKVPEIKQCAVIHAVSKNHTTKLIAFIATDVQMEDAFVRNELKKYLPGYMIPNRFKYMKELPKNPNGKIDRNGLVELWHSEENSK